MDQVWHILLALFLVLIYGGVEASELQTGIINRNGVLCLVAPTENAEVHSNLNLAATVLVFGSQRVGEVEYKEVELAGGAIGWIKSADLLTTTLLCQIGRDGVVLRAEPHFEGQVVEVFPHADNIALNLIPAGSRTDFIESGAGGAEDFWYNMKMGEQSLWFFGTEASYYHFGGLLEVVSQMLNPQSPEYDIARGTEFLEQIKSKYADFQVGDGNVSQNADVYALRQLFKIYRSQRRYKKAIATIEETNSILKSRNQLSTYERMLGFFDIGQIYARYYNRPAEGLSYLLKVIISAGHSGSREQNILDLEYKTMLELTDLLEIDAVELPRKKELLTEMITAALGERTKLLARISYASNLQQAGDLDGALAAYLQAVTEHLSLGPVRWQDDQKLLQHAAFSGWLELMLAERHDYSGALELLNQIIVDQRAHRELRALAQFHRAELYYMGPVDLAITLNEYLSIDSKFWIATDERTKIAERVAVLEQQDQLPVPKSATVKVPSSALKELPYAGAKELSKLAKGTKLAVYYATEDSRSAMGQEDYWHKVQSDKGIWGWAFGAALQLKK